MGNVKTNWLTPGHSGRACKHDDVYTKQNKKTGKVYSVKLCYPNTDWSGDQIAHRITFGTISAALAAWIKTNKTSESNDYKYVKKMFDHQSTFGTLRGMMYAKGMYSISGGTVTVNPRLVSSGSSSATSTAKKTLTLTVSPAGGGTVTGAGEYNLNASVQITATAADGYTFKKWNDNNENASRTVTMSDNLTLQAVFETSTTQGGSTENSGGSGWGSNNNP